MRLRLIVIMAAVFVALGVLFVIAARPRPVQQAESRPIVWSVEMQELEAIAISLPRDGKSEAWVKHADKYWYFDRPGGPKVDMNRWGGGIPLILSGPAAERHITAESTAEQLEEYGLADPRMRILRSVPRAESAWRAPAGNPAAAGRTSRAATAPAA